MRKGQPMPLEGKLKMSIARKGKKQPNISKAKKGKKLSLEHRANIAKSHEGKHYRPRKNPVSKETREKLSKANMGHEVSLETREKISNSQKDKFVPKEVGRKISESLKKYNDSLTHEDKVKRYGKLFSSRKSKDTKTKRTFEKILLSDFNNTERRKIKNFLRSYNFELYNDEELIDLFLSFNENQCEENIDI